LRADNPFGKYFYFLKKKQNAMTVAWLLNQTPLLGRAKYADRIFLFYEFFPPTIDFFTILIKVALF
jgi:hypothetical protein